MLNKIHIRFICVDVGKVISMSNFFPFKVGGVGVLLIASLD